MAILTNEPTMIVKVYSCARCTRDHSDIEFKPFHLNTISDPSGDYTHWAACPISNEPVLLRVTPVEEEHLYHNR